MYSGRIRTVSYTHLAVLTEVVEDAYDRLIAPAIEREIRNNLTEEAEDGAIKVLQKDGEQLTGKMGKLDAAALNKKDCLLYTSRAMSF